MSKIPSNAVGYINGIFSGSAARAQILGAKAGSVANIGGKQVMVHRRMRAGAAIRSGAASAISNTTGFARGIFSGSAARSEILSAAVGKSRR